MTDELWDGFRPTLFGYAGLVRRFGYLVVVELRQGTSAALCLARRPANDDLGNILR